MSKISFQVSAKAARLIGRESIADVDGAIIELVKNSYDADASCVFIKFLMPFPSVPSKINVSQLYSHFSEDERNSLFKFYDKNGDIFSKKADLSREDSSLIESIFFSKNVIILADNGHGMTYSTLSDTWMSIGTSDKEFNIYSPNGRIKTGAKGIGRFALDKLSVITKLYTKNELDDFYYWDIDWNQFANVQLLSQVEANLEKMDIALIDKLKELIGDDFSYVENECWDTGSIFILSPTRESWSNRLFNKVNTNLKSLNPLGSIDSFNVYVVNNYFKEFNYTSKDLSIVESLFDYRIQAKYDGDKSIFFSMYRNEINTKLNNIELKINNSIHSFPLEDFWARKAFQSPSFYKDDYHGIINNSLIVTDFLGDELEKIQQIGSFELDFYFLKNAKSTVEIVNDINVRGRKNLLENFSGIKLYRDNFKVRPYGDDGALYDWLSLGERVIKSPAAASHDSGMWRVSPNQLIGSVKISRIENSVLEDMANREGLTLNEYYYIFIDILQKLVEIFESDRQYIFREFAEWKNEIKKSFDTTGTVVDSVVKKKEKKKSKKTTSNSGGNNSEDDTGNQEYSNAEYEDAVYQLYTKSQEFEKTLQILMAFSSSGIITNTFAHEIRRIQTEFTTMDSQLKASIDYILDYNEFTGDEDFNPYVDLETTEKMNQLLGSWIGIIMDAVEKENFEKKDVHLDDFVNKILDSWKPLMAKKAITFEYTPLQDVDSIIPISEVDLYLLFNNFFLNSAWFLESASSGIKKISISFNIQSSFIVIQLKNNGSPLNAVFKNNPNIIFEAGVTSKPNESSTGLGLWICKEVVKRNNGEIHCLNIDDGFSIEIKLPL
ncbi:hypothetical protein MmiHf6_10310 [Methanimicrococcus hongohii]|uniref:Histidine kinase domain-containing protein n=1 Tax=Methanimicrococcus hongohii TaxID=3028295 RepID=A0AA96VB58_9EURY|nr:sensor histidine kinase [Methanimicrococcus sp. Hf6]WNY23717.1 hypothetical protein MmiHf6_10310 [Methanimicrococcus sp. Hf6]